MSTTNTDLSQGDSFMSTTNTDTLLLSAAVALRGRVPEFRGHDLPYGSKAYTQANTFFGEIAKHFNVSSVEFSNALPIVDKGVKS